MCDSRTKLIFCRCKDQLEGREIIWVLERKGLQKIDKPGLWVGAMMIPREVAVDQYSPDDILEILQYESPFDFPYKPKQGDSFRFRFKGVWSLSYNFAFSRGNWRRIRDQKSEYEMLKIAEGTLHVIDLNKAIEPSFRTLGS